MKNIIFSLLIFIGSGLLSPNLVFASLDVWVVGESEKVQPLDAPQTKNYIWDSLQKNIEIKGGRNEYVAFQLIVRSDTPLEDVTVEVSDLEGNGNTISKENIILFREWYINTPASSQFTTERAGEFPDPLIPFVDPYGTEQNVGAPFPLVADRNQPIWVDLYIPKKTNPGIYQGSVKVLAAGQTLTNLKLMVEVWKLTLPSEQSLTAWIPLYGVRLGKGEGFNDWDFPNDEAWNIVREYFRMARQHRFMTQLGDGYDGLEIDWDESTGNIRSINWAKYDKYIGEVLNGRLFADGLPPKMWKVGGFVWWGARPGSSPHFGGNFQVDSVLTPQHRNAIGEYAQAILAHFKEKSWSTNNLFFYMIDEPQYEYYTNLDRLVASYGEAVHAATDKIKHLVATIPQETEKHIGAVDIWACWAAGYWVPTMKKRQALGELGWFYQYGEPFCGSININAPALAMRTWPWIAWKYGVDGIFAWVGNFWNDNPYTDPMNFNTERISNGIIFYPGNKLTQIGLPSIKGPVSSLRMKALRRGLQDYEYLTFLGDRARQIVDETIQTALNENEYDPYWEHPLFGEAGGWSHDPEHWYNARERLANIILSTLSVKVLKLNATVHGSEVRIAWMVEQSNNKCLLSLQRRGAISDFVTIAQSELSDSVGVIRHFSYTDRISLPGSYAYRLAWENANSKQFYSDQVWVTVNTAKEFVLNQNFPNPFIHATVIPIEVPRKSRVKVEIYTLTGRKICTVVDKTLGTGFHTFNWKGQNDFGTKVASGIYVCKMKTDEFVSNRKLVLIH